MSPPLPISGWLRERVRLVPGLVHGLVPFGIGRRDRGRKAKVGWERFRSGPVQCSLGLCLYAEQVPNGSGRKIGLDGPSVYTGPFWNRNHAVKSPKWRQALNEQTKKLLHIRGHWGV